MSDIEHSFTLHSSRDPSVAPYVEERIAISGLVQIVRHDCSGQNPILLMRDLAAWNADRMSFRLGAPKVGVPIPDAHQVARFTFAMVSCPKGGCYIETCATVDGVGKRLERIEVPPGSNAFKKVAELATEEAMAFGFFKAVNTPSQD